ncbi:MAG: hypothetical protein JXN65_02170 [Clostridia bacterium]|nr:hypothetical protein [Clostridia bacterium]
MKLGFLSKNRRIIASLVLALLTLPIVILIGSDLLDTNTSNKVLRIIVITLYISSALCIYFLGMPKGTVTINESGIFIEIAKNVFL